MIPASSRTQISSGTASRVAWAKRRAPSSRGGAAPLLEVQGELARGLEGAGPPVGQQPDEQGQHRRQGDADEAHQGGPPQLRGLHQRRPAAHQERPGVVGHPDVAVGGQRRAGLAGGTLAHGGGVEHAIGRRGGVAVEDLEGELVAQVLEDGGHEVAQPEGGVGPAEQRTDALGRRPGRRAVPVDRHEEERAGGAVARRVDHQDHLAREGRLPGVAGALQAGAPHRLRADVVAVGLSVAGRGGLQVDHRGVLGRAPPRARPGSRGGRPAARRGRRPGSASGRTRWMKPIPWTPG